MAFALNFETAPPTTIIIGICAIETAIPISPTAPKKLIIIPIASAKINGIFQTLNVKANKSNSSKSELITFKILPLVLSSPITPLLSFNTLLDATVATILLTLPVVNNALKADCPLQSVATKLVKAKAKAHKAP